MIDEAPTTEDLQALARRLVDARRRNAVGDREKERARVAADRADKTAAIRAELDGHAKALAFFDEMMRPGGESYARCSRRAAKSNAICRALAAVANERASNCFYFGLTGPAVNKTIWMEVWEPLIRRHFPTARMNGTEKFTVLPSGGKVFFAGVDDLRYIETILGAGAAGGLVVLDEVQSVPEDVHNRMVDELLPPILSDDKGQGAGTFVRSGTITRVPHGRAYDDWHRESSVKKHSFSRFDNPFLQNQHEELRKYLERRPNLSMKSPIVLRDWFNEEAYDEGDRAWTGFRDELYPAGNLYEGDPPKQDFYSFACDPGGQDEYAIEGVGWSTRSPLVYQVGEWCTDEGERVPLSRARDEVIARDNQYHPIAWAYDSNSANVNDTYTSDWGVVMMVPARKVDFRGQFDRMNDLLAQRRLLVRKGSRLHADMVKARLNAAAFRDGGAKPWDPSYHGNCHDAARYALAKYFSIYKETPAKKTMAEAMIAAEEKRAAESLQMGAKVAYGPAVEPGGINGYGQSNGGGYGG